MTFILTAEQQREMDRRAIADFGMPHATLMENAGWAVYKVAKKMLGGSTGGKRIAVVCGTGDNGGDGFVTARLLHLRDASVDCFVVGDPAKLKASSALNYRLAEAMLGRVAPFDPKIEPRDYDLIVDALLGTGLKGDPREEHQAAIRWMNEQKTRGRRTPLLSIDIPSGVNADTGETAGAELPHAVAADETVTFCGAKWGHYLPPGNGCAGRLHVFDIGFQWDLVAAEPVLERMTEPVAPDFLRKRAIESNKGDYGRVFIVGGSAGMSGAPVLAARAAQLAGAGLVTIAAPACLQSVLASKIDEQMSLAFPDADGAFAANASEKLLDELGKGSAVCLGPGMTMQSGAATVARELIARLERPLIVDADALNALAEAPETARQRDDFKNAPLILTPHPGEAARLLGTTTDLVQSNRRQSALDLASRYNAIAVLKGRHTLIAAPDGRISVNTTGNPGMATGGAGDTLTGILGGIVAQCVEQQKRKSADEALDLFEGVALGVWLHGKAGDFAAEAVGEASLVASDIARFLPEAILSLVQKD